MSDGARQHGGRRVGWRLFYRAPCPHALTYEGEPSVPELCDGAATALLRQEAVSAGRGLFLPAVGCFCQRRAPPAGVVVAAERARPRSTGIGPAMRVHHLAPVLLAPPLALLTASCLQQSPTAAPEIDPMGTTRRVANPIAVRRYGVDGEPGREVVLTLGKPRKDPRLTNTWRCAVQIDGIPKQKHRRGYGVDAVQALQDAMVCARRELDASGLRLTWLDGEPGALDLPLPVPTGWGLDFQQRLERYVRRETRKLARAIAAAGKAKAQRRRAREEPPEEGSTE